MKFKGKNLSETIRDGFRKSMENGLAYVLTSELIIFCTLHGT